ncbi:MAG: DNA polymerase III subunit gamma/tau [Erysipelotrichaceae bacterium]|nr:DNA polymerase III subunit gamma/tau [Erysipelotrichaceae bacterium]
MSYQALYRKYRPKEFKEVVGQNYIVTTLLNAIKQGKIAHAYLFAGPRGTGKTSVAKLFAKEINCQEENNQDLDNAPNIKAFNDNNHPDVIELDAASNNSVDDIREIVDKVYYAPILGKYKVYIIDEVHMLSNSAFNALLKTLEEPPKNVIFILATTDPQKIIPTVLSRVQRYNFKKVDIKDIVLRIENILKIENISYEEEAIKLIASLADGGMRDALSILDQVLVYGGNKLLTEKVYEAYGILQKEAKVNLIKAIISKKYNEIIDSASNYNANGIDLKRLTNDLLKIYKELMIYHSVNHDFNLQAINKEDADEILARINKNILLKSIDILMDSLNKYKNATELRDYFELCLLKMASLDSGVENFDNEIKLKEKNLDNQDYQVITTDKIIEQEKVEDNHQIIDYTPEKDYLLYLLRNSTKEEKNLDLFIYEQLEDFKYDMDKRCYYEAIINTKIIASGADAIIFETTDKNNFNDPEFNEKLYIFFRNDLDIDKMVYGIDSKDKESLFEYYRSNIGNNIQDYEVVRYEVKESEKLEDQLITIYGDIEIMED